MHWLLALVVPIVAKPPPFVPRATIECSDGRAVAIETNGDALALVGDCASVTIAGRGNTLTIASTRRLVVTGGGNRVASNVLDVIDVRGDANYVASSTSARGPIVHNTGTDNTIVVGRQITIQTQ